MTRIEKKLFYRSGLLCLALIALVLAADAGDLLTNLERRLYDRRAVDFQYFTPKPSDLLIHLDIDDPSLDAIGAWPWPRTRLALVIDEIRQAGAKALALDMILSEPQEPRSERLPDGSLSAPIDDDANLAAAFKRFGNVLIPLPLAYEEVETRTQQTLHKAVAEQLASDLELDLDEMARRLSKNPLVTRLGLQQLHRDIEDVFAPTRREIMYDRIYAAISPTAKSLDELRRELLPRLDENITGHELLRLRDSQYEKVKSVKILEQLVPSANSKVGAVLHRRVEIPPIPELADAGSTTGVLNYVPDSDGVLRSLPLWVEHKGHLYPQLGLSLVCMMFDVDVRTIQLSNGHVKIPRPGKKPIMIPVRQQYAASQGESVNYFMDIPWFGPKDHWELLYDPLRRRPEQHVPLLRVWQIINKRQRIEKNNATLDDALLHLLSLFNDHAPFEEFKATRLAAGDVQSRTLWIARAQKMWEQLAKDDPSLSLENLRKTQPAARSKDENELIRSLTDLQVIPKKNGELQADFNNLQVKLRESLNGKAVLIGWTATGAAADFVPTSLHAKCPGPIVHGVVFNGIMTGELWSTAPAGTTWLITISLGVLVTLATISLSPGRSLLVAILLATAYWFFNGLFFFDWGNLIVGNAAPLAVITTVWSGGTLFRFVAERRERAYITRRFQSYVDPVLVEYVLQNEQTRFDGQEREMTVVFTDLAGFTTLSERLKSKTVGILNEYIDLMVPVISENRGFVNKFLGDGIMFFYGAPQENEDHALHSVITVLKMQETLLEFNQSLAARDLPPVKMRAGISSGLMTVGDAGGSRRSDYTVLGDTVNLAARLESANKAIGTLTMISTRTAELVEPSGLFLLRPIGKLQVVGKSEGIMTYEPILAASATDEQKKLVEFTKLMVELYQAGKFEQCIIAADELEKHFGHSKLVDLYRTLSKQYMVTPPPEGFSGQIVLSEK